MRSTTREHGSTEGCLFAEGMGNLMSSRGTVGGNNFKKRGIAPRVVASSANLRMKGTERASECPTRDCSKGVEKTDQRGVFLREKERERESEKKRILFPPPSV